MQIDKDEMERFETMIQRKVESTTAVEQGEMRNYFNQELKKNYNTVIELQQKLEKMEHKTQEKFDSVDKKLDEIIYLLKGDGHTVMGVATQADEAYKFYQRLTIKETEKKADSASEFAKKAKWLWTAFGASVASTVWTIIYELVIKK